MGFFDKIKNAVNPSDDNYGDYDDIYDDGGFEDDGYEEPTNYSQAAAAQRQPASSGMGLNSGALELKVVKPEKYDSATAQKLADHLLNKRSVV